MAQCGCFAPYKWMAWSGVAPTPPPTPSLPSYKLKYKEFYLVGVSGCAKLGRPDACPLHVG